MYETINGFPIIATYFTPATKSERAGRIILVDRIEDHGERYVVAWQAYDGHEPRWHYSWIMSAYCATLKDARKVFAKRIEREPA